jgi:hypothetical protein
MPGLWIADADLGGLLSLPELRFQRKLLFLIG